MIWKPFFHLYVPSVRKQRLIAIVCVWSLISFLVILNLCPFGSICGSDELWTQNENEELLSSPCVCVNGSKVQGYASRDIYPFQYKSVNHDLKCALTSLPKGRLGNLMGQYATLLALAKINKRPAFILTAMEKELKKYFNITLPSLQSIFLNLKPWTEYKLNDWMESEYSSLPNGFLFLVGYPNSWTFYNDIKNIILKEFTFHEPIIREVQSHLRRIRGSRTRATFIGIHVRRGDYVRIMNEKYDGVIASPDYFLQAMQYFRNRYPNCVFLVCSDDLQWCKNHIDASQKDVHFCWNGTSRSPGHDMALLSFCNHSIMTIGTFGFWASYLTKGEVIYLDNFVRPSSAFLKVFKYKSFYLPEWKGINADLSYV